MQGFIVTNLLEMLAHRLNTGSIGAIGASGGFRGSSLCVEGATWLCTS